MSTPPIQPGSVTGVVVAGIVFGFSAGFSPGPLMAFVTSQTLRYGHKEGFKASIAPLAADLPIALISTCLLGWVSGYQSVVGVISLLGAAFALFLGYERLQASAILVDTDGPKPWSFGKGAIVTALSPYPYLFWFLVGAPQLVKAWGLHPLLAAGFVTGFYGCFISANLLVVAMVGRSRQWLVGRPYRYLMRFLGIMLVIAAILLLRDGLKLLGVSFSGKG